jgi:hypothetical protein
MAACQRHEYDECNADLPRKCDTPSSCFSIAKIQNAEASKIAYNAHFTVDLLEILAIVTIMATKTEYSRRAICGSKAQTHVLTEHQATGIPIHMPHICTSGYNTIKHNISILSHYGSQDFRNPMFPSYTTSVWLSLLR